MKYKKDLEEIDRILEEDEDEEITWLIRNDY
jgi:hypothetical protein